MHRQRLTLNGPRAAVARLADDLRAAGAVAVAGPTAGPPRLVWETPRRSALEDVCARHRTVAVGVERFELLGDELQRLVVHGTQATVLERRALADDDAPEHVCVDEDEGAPLDPAALRTAARTILLAPVDLRPGPTGTVADDALLIGRAVGRFCTTVADDGPGRATLAALAAAALTLPAATPVCAAERRFERDWRLTRAVARAAAEPLWSRPGEADWPEWLMALLCGTAQVIDACAACLHQPPPPFVSIHTEYSDTEAEQLEHASGHLTVTALQALVLFQKD